MPLSPYVRSAIEAEHGPEQADVHEQLHDTIEQAWLEYEARKAQFDAVLAKDTAELEAQTPRWEDKERWRDGYEKIDAKYNTAMHAAHDAYEKACQDAHTVARAAGLRS